MLVQLLHGPNTADRQEFSENEVHGQQVIDSSLELNRTTWQKVPRSSPVCRLRIEYQGRHRQVAESLHESKRGCKESLVPFRSVFGVSQQLGFSLSDLRPSARGSLELESQRPPLEGPYLHDNAADRPLGVGLSCNLKPQSDVGR